MGIFTDLFSTKPAEEAAKQKALGFSNAKTDANAALDTGLAQATPLYDQAYTDFSTLGAKFGKGQDAYNDATGVNGADGLARPARRPAGLVFGRRRQALTLASRASGRASTTMQRLARGRPTLTPRWRRIAHRLISGAPCPALAGWPSRRPALAVLLRAGRP